MVLTGPVGVGKQRLALWIAQLLFCERPADEPCGSCIGCRQTLELRHPDLHWLIPIPRPKAADPEKQVEEAAEAIGELLEERLREVSASAVLLHSTLANLDAWATQLRVQVLGDD